MACSPVDVSQTRRHDRFHGLLITNKPLAFAGALPNITATMAAAERKSALDKIKKPDMSPNGSMSMELSSRSDIRRFTAKTIAVPNLLPQATPPARGHHPMQRS